jgi:hypothetical protein
MNTPQLCRLSGLSTHLRLPARWLKAEAKAGRIPCLQVGARMLFNIEAVERALAERAAQPPTRTGGAA